MTRRRRSRFGRTASQPGAVSRRRLSAESLEPRLVLDSTVVFNELMYNPISEPQETGEWIELYNQLAVDMDVSEWRIEGGVDYTFPDGTIVPGRGFLLVAASAAGVTGAAGGVEVVSPFVGRLANNGEELRLYNNDDRLMNTLDYGDGGKWPVEPDGSGASLAKRQELTASEDFTNWTHSPEVGGTPGAINFDSPVIGNPDLITLLPADQPVSVFVPSNGTLGTTWTQLGFNDAAWTTGNAGVGFENQSGYEPHFNLDVDSIMDGVNTSIYIRHEFNSTVDPADIDSLFLQMKYDDGFVAYLNGTEIEDDNALDGKIWSSAASDLHDDGLAVGFVDFNISGFKNLLNVGANVLAIHGLNRSIGSSDFLISPKISYTEVDEGGGGPTLDGPIPLAINEVSPLAGNKFIEIANYGNDPIPLDGMVLHTTGLSGGDYTFPVQSLASGERLVLTEAQLGVTMADNERFFLFSADGETVIDGQPITNRLRGLTTDGQWLYPDVATPNAVNSFDLNEDIVINEIMYHHQSQLATATTPYADSNEEWIEIYNRGAGTVDLSDWELRDAVQFQFAAGTMLDSDEYLVVAKDPTSLAQEFPGITIVGPFSGSLSNSEDRILLVDDFANPADVVKYYESGQWNDLADGGGSSLELKDPFADNAIGGAWAASDETSKSSWNSYTVSKIATEPLFISSLFEEFVFGMLDSGEVLIDNLSVTRTGSAVEHIANGNFEAFPLNAPPTNWRLIGNHSGMVVNDPDNASNQVLHLVAAGAQQHVHDHVEVTFASGQQIQDNQTYTYSFDAKWLSGSRQLNSRLYFTRASNTIILDAPQDNGTPGAQNSQFESNIGPTYTDFGHAPVLPSTNEPVTVTVAADDPNGVSSMTLFYNLNGGAWTQVPMALSGGLYSAGIPGQSSGQVVQFYVEGTDGLGAISTFPEAGPDSRALYEVNDGQGTSRPVETFRIVLLSSDNNHLFSSEDRMSNHYLGGTMIVGDHTPFYDVGIRQVGSRFIRPNSGYKVKLNADQKFLGVHESIRFDINQLGEILMKQMVNRAAGSEVSMYDDISYMISPQHSGRMMLLNLARYESVYLREQFENGTDGTKFEQDDITYPTNGNGPNNEKTGTGVSAQDILYRGSDPEAYRGQLLIKNNRDKDDFATMAEFARVINLNGGALDAAIDDVMDVDLWMRHYATQSFLGNWDTYGFRRPKNLRLYIRPDDGKVIPLFWDADLGNFSEPFIYNGNDSRLDEIRNLPRNERLFWGHMWDLMNRSFNGDYVGPWVSHYNSLGVGTDSANTVQNRNNAARSAAQSAIPMVAFSITTNGGNPLTVPTSSTNLVGNGWIDVREIRLAGSSEALDATWTDNNSWSIGIPLAMGANTIALEAYDFEGNLIGTDSITVTSTATQLPLRDVLRVTELNYHPTDPTSAELAVVPTATDGSFEYIELTNIGPSIINLAGVQISSPVSFTFPTLNLQPGSRVLVVRDQAAFSARYSGAFPIGEWGASTGLPNAGGTITLLDSDSAVIQSFAYDDNNNWPSLADGGGHSLQIIDPAGDYNDPLNWLPSSTVQGNPGQNGIPIPSPFGLRITELNYNPPVGVGAEFIEIVNDSDAVISLFGTRFVEGVEFDFTTSSISSLQPGEFALVVSNVADFNNAYGAGKPIAGAFTSGSLANGGERVILFDLLGNAIHDFVYDDEAPWPTAADGNGSSLEIVSTSGDYRSASNWTASSVAGGTPGTNGTLFCDYVGGGDGCDLDDLNALYAGTNGAPTPLTDNLINEWLVDASSPANPLKPNANSTFVFGDVDLDGNVNSTDLGLLLNNFNNNGGLGWGSGNLNSDSAINSTDLGLVLNNFNFASLQVAAGAASASVEVAVMAEPEDVNGDGIVSPLDALQIINYLNSQETKRTISSKTSDTAPAVTTMDVDGDGDVIPLDALLVMNRLNQTNPANFDNVYAEFVFDGDDEDEA